MDNNLFWLSWYEKEEDHRPLTYPPNDAILGWWCSGERCSDNASTICAYVEALDEEKAWKSVAKDWPSKGDREVRFCNALARYKPSDRFPEKERMVERLGRWK